MKITRRNTERFHHFANQVAKFCEIHDLQGLLMNENWRPTAAIEAYELSEPCRKIKAMMPVKELYIKCVFAEQVGVPMYLVTHVKGEDMINIYKFQADHESKKPICIGGEKKSEQDFIHWWRTKKQTVQNKNYRKDLSGRIADSYFDRLLESNGEKWGGNIDGYLVDWSSGDAQIRGIVENRFTNKTPLRTYDPNQYFRYGGGDYYTWLPLFNLHQDMNVPLVLATYSNRTNETCCTGLTTVESLTQNGLEYSSDCQPCKNIQYNIENIQEWLKCV